MTKLPWMPFYGSDFFADEFVQTLTREERYLYLTLLWHQWREGSIPADSDSVRAILHLGVAVDEEGFAQDEHEHIMGWITERFKPVPGDPDRLHNPKLEALRLKHLAKHRGHVLGGKRSHKSRPPKNVAGYLEPASSLVPGILKDALNIAGGESDKVKDLDLSNGRSSPVPSPPSAAGPRGDGSEQDGTTPAIMARFHERQRAAKVTP